MEPCVFEGVDMKLHDCGRAAAASFFISVMLAGCGGSQSAPAQPLPAAQAAVAHPNVVVSSRGMRSDTPNGWSPANLQSAYKLPSAKKGSGEIVALVTAYDNPNVASDLAQYRSTFGLPPASFFKYNQNGQQSNFPSGSPAWGVVIDLDVEMVSASCPNCTIYLIEANSGLDSDLGTAEDEAVKLGAHIVSNDWNCAASSPCVDRSHFNAKGVEYLAPVADFGADVGAPASYDRVVAVGGTKLTQGGGGKRGWTEYAWGDVGGCSMQPKPRWQHFAACTFRMAADVAAIADNVAAYDTYGGQTGWTRISGTGVAAPFLAGVFGLAGNATQQDGGRTFWQTPHQKDLYPVPEGSTQCTFVHGRYNTCAGWGSPHGIGAF